eukprot:263541_1
MSSQMKQIKAIKDAIRKEQLDELRILATKHGFINDKLRKKAWPLMLGIKTVQRHKTHKHKHKKKKGKTKPRSRSVDTGSLDMEIEHRHSSRKPKPIQISTTGKTVPSLSLPISPFKLKISTKLPEIEESKTTTTPPPKHKFGSYDASAEYSQIEKDIGRSSLKYYNLYAKRGKRKSEASLSKILHDIFDENDELHYIQGFNDVTSVFYAVCNNEKLAQTISNKVARTLLSDYIMMSEDEHINVVNYKLIFDIIECHDKELRLYLDNAHDFISISISWLLTWFAHQIKDITIISRIYDYCLCSDKLISSYLSAALVIYLRNELLDAAKHDISLFEFFTDIKWDKLDFEEIIHLSDTLHERYSVDLNQRFKEHINNARNDLYYTDSTDSPVPVTPYTPWTPSATPRKGSMDSNAERSPFDNIDFAAMKNERQRNSKKRKLGRNAKAKKEEIKKAIKGFIDDYLAKNDEDQ